MHAKSSTTHPHPYAPPRRHRAVRTFDPEQDQRFANLASALGFLAILSIAGSVAALDGFDAIVYGRGSEVGEFGVLVFVAIAAIAFVVVAQQLGASLGPRARVAAVLGLVATVIAGPLFVALRSVGG